MPEETRAPAATRRSRHRDRRRRHVVARRGLHTLVLAVIAGGSVAFAGTVAPDSSGSSLTAGGPDAGGAPGVDRASAQLMASRFESRPEVAGTAVEVVVDGAARELTTEASDVAGLLAEADIVVDNDDVVSHPLSAPVMAGMRLEVTTVDTADEHVTETESFDTIEEEDATLVRGQRRVVRQGVDGVSAATYRVTTSAGEETSRELVARAVRSERVDEVVRVGTADPAPPPRPSSGSSSSGGSSGSGSSGGSSGGSVSGDVWAALAQCESGGSPTIVSPNGLYHGLYQFSVSTWQSVGGSGLPSQASPAEQTERAKALQARSGWGQWPACSSRLGLR